MKQKRHKHIIGCLFFLIFLIGIVACGSRGSSFDAAAPVAEEAVFEEVSEGIPVEVTRVVTEIVGGEAEEVMAEEPAADLDDSRAPTDNQPAQQQRLIIKDGDMTITVDDADTAVSQATDIAIDVGGYIISQTVFDDSQGYRFATMRLGVPVDNFETALKALRQLGTVTNESASGVDVTDEFVDLNSRLDNLTATRDRLRTFLEEAVNVDEALRVNQELRQVEEEIAVIQGRVNFLADRAAFSTIDLTLNPWIPTPTPSPTPTATPIPTAESWRPLDTAKVAGVELQETAQDTADFIIFNGIARGPWILFWGLILWIGWRLYRRVTRREAAAQAPLISHEEEQ